MTSFDATLFAADGESGTPAVVSILGETLTVSVYGAVVGQWPLAALEVTRSRSHFEIAAPDEYFAIELGEADEFALLVGAAEGASADVQVDAPTPREQDRPSASANWWKFWDRSAWVGWMVRREPWREYRRQAKPIESELKATRRRITEQQVALKDAQRDLAWAAALRLRDLPLKTRRNETGLGVVPGVTLKEIRKKDGKDVWTAIDSGPVYVTDRRLVFSGKKDVEFRYDKLETKQRRREGLLLGVTSRKRSHVLAGPIDHLLVALAGGIAASQGLPPAERFERAVSDLTSRLSNDETTAETLRAALEQLDVPARPISPAWVPTVILATLVGIGSFAVNSDDAPTLAAATTTAANDTTSAAPTTTERATTTTRIATTTSTQGSTTTQSPDAELLATFASLLGAPTASASGDPAASAPSGSTSVEVISITDGDTLDVRLPNGSTDTVRLIGVNAPESNECFADVASLALAALAPPGQTISLTTDVTDRDQFDRLLRYAWLGGLSINEELVRRGVAIARKYPPDTARAELLEAAQNETQALGIGIWATDACGPASTLEVSINRVNHDAAGNDNENLNDEWIRIRNTGTVVATMSAWTIRDESASNRYTFPTGFTLAPDESVTIYTGCGTDFGLDLYWCSQGTAIWNNDGDTAFLIDPNGNIHDTWNIEGERPSTTTTTPAPTTTTADDRAGCHPSYPTVCIPPPPPDLDCGDIPYRRFTVTGSDPHRFDGDNDGVGCES